MNRAAHPRKGSDLASLRASATHSAFRQEIGSILAAAPVARWRTMQSQIAPRSGAR